LTDQEAHAELLKKARKVLSALPSEDRVREIRLVSDGAALFVDELNDEELATIVLRYS